MRIRNQGYGVSFFVVRHDGGTMKVEDVGNYVL